MCREGVVVTSLLPDESSEVEGGLKLRRWSDPAIVAIAFIALASGFGSLRRFNEVFQKLYHRPPTTLRRQSARDLPASDDEVTLQIRYRPPYDWESMLAFFAARSITAFLFDVNPGSPAIFLSAVTLLAATALIAATIPARRASTIDPMQALRSE